MATALRNKSFQRNLFFSIGSIFILFAVCFGIYQHQREKVYKIDILHTRLQMFNYKTMRSLGEQGILCDSIFLAYTKAHSIEGMRVTVIDTNGRVLQDNNNKNIDSLSNHLKRHEVQEALIHGNGYDIKRTSETTNETYFYSATKFKHLIIRTAVPYSTELTEFLQTDYSYFYFTIFLTFLLVIVLYLNTSRISRHIEHLREFAIKAEKGEKLDHELERRLPNDELGDISHTIITLYWKLRHSEEDKARIKRQLTQNAAHELKTPAMSIHGYIESILDNPDMSPEKRLHFLERCYAQSERMNRLLMDMAQLTRLEETPLALSENTKGIINVDIVPIIKNVLDDTSLQLNEKGIQSIVELPERIIISSPLSEPEEVLYSVFRNLVDNAIFYATGATEIRIIYNDREFSFSDNGVGVSPKHLPYLFERFYRVDKGRSRKMGGTGLGLAIVKNAVTAHGGTISAHTTPGGGLTIKFTFPK